MSAGSKELASYVYNDYNGKLREMAYSNGLTVKYTYDELDRIKEIQYNTGSGSEDVTAYVYEYAANGSISKIDDRLSGQVTVCGYDSRGRLCNLYVNDRNNESDQSAIYCFYDNEGRLETREYTRDVGSGETMYAVTDIGYEDDGSVGSISTRVQGIRFIAEYSHDDFRRTTGIVMSIDSYEYDSDEPRTITQSYTYLNYEDGDYYETPLIHSVTTTRPDGSETLYYTYDERGNITSIRRGVNDIVCRYTYDDLGQLIREDNRAHGATYTWTYDNAGNILSSKTYAYTTGSLGSAQRTVSYDYSSGSWGDLLTSNNGRSVTYDNIGNPLRWNDYGELTWQGRRLMRYYESEMECESLYTYNADGIRTSKTVNGVKHTYHLSGTQILSEEWTDRWNRHVMVYIYDAAGQPIGMSHFQDGTLVDTYLYEKNIQGDVVAVYEYDGDLVVRYAYNAWGAVSETEYGSEYDESSFAVECNPFRYRGYYYDTETDLYYLNSRYYDPAVGRFLNADGVDFLGTDEGLLSYNLFAYCLNDPVNRTDDSGNLSIKNWIKIGVGAIALGAAIALTVATGGGAAAVAIGVAKVVGSVALSTAVSAGAGYLKNGKQGAIDGACNGFMLGSLSALGGAAFKYAKVHSATTGSPNSMGKAGERMAGIDQSAKEPIQINGRTRIPDAMTDTTLIEVKNVKYISNTQQLRDFAAFANATGRSLELWVRPTTRIAKTVIDAGWHINYLW